MANFNEKPIRYFKTPTGETLHLKNVYEVKHSIKPFFSPKSRGAGGRLAHTKDGQFLICPFQNGFTIVDSNGFVLSKIQEFQDALLSLCIDENEDIPGMARIQIFSGWQSSLIRHYNGEDDKAIKSWKVHDCFVLSLDYAKGRNLLASTHSDHKLRIWEIKNGHYKPAAHNTLLGSLSHVVRWHPHPDWFHLFTWGSSRELAIWRYNENGGKILKIGKLEGHLNLLTDITFHLSSPNLLYTSGRDGVIIEWDISKDTTADYKTRLITLQQSLELLCMSTTEEGLLYLFAASFRGEIFVVDPIKWKNTSRILPYGRIFESSESRTDPPASLSISQLYVAERNVYIVNHEQSIHCIDIKDFSVSDYLVGCNDEILSLSLLKDNQLIIAANSEVIRIYQPLSEEFGQFGKPTMLDGHKDLVLCVDGNCNGDRFVSGSKDQTILIWQMIGESWAKVAIGKGHAHNVNAVAFSKLANDFVVSTGQDMTLKVWNLSELVEPYEKVIKITTHWTRGGHSKEINTVDVAPNDRYIATGSKDKTAKIWNVSNGEEITTLSGHKKGIWCVKFSPFDQCLATASIDTMIRVWNISDFDCMRTFQGHTSGILQIDFITKGTQLVSCASEGILKVWNIKSMSCDLTLDIHKDKIWGLLTLEDGKYLITGSSDSNVHVLYDMTVENEEIRLQKEKDLLIREQDLENLLQVKNYEKAVKLALDMPRKLYLILEKIIEAQDYEPVLTRIILSLELSELSMLFPHIVKWNTNSKFYLIAQITLNIIFRSIPNEKLKEIDNIRNHMEAIHPYSQRHMARVDKLIQDFSIVDYVSQLKKLSKSDTK
ncbi:Transducin beta-like protein 3 [Oopsacas minuta]|uniref:Transducin beta-like protein 3 n=1 Tax=Oopsacas minuta TaxID=111878 RepID=A0AAV7JNT3_9METZ|nr:Transducin beta-like protein 3 [Oopsacas minuta]